MKIIVKRIDGEKTTIEVDGKCSVGNMKKLFSDKTGIPPAQIRLVFGGAPLLGRQDSDRIETD